MATKTRKTKRVANEGTILERTDGRWCSAVTQPNGKRKYFYGSSSKEVAKKLLEARKTLEKGLPLPSDKRKLKHLLKQWLDDVVKPGTRPNVYARYEINVRVHLIPALGEKKLTKLTAEELQTFYRLKLESGLAPRTVGQIHATLRNALNVALKWGWITRNVAYDAKPPAVEEVSEAGSNRLTANQAIRLLDEVKKEKWLDGPATIAAVTGLRLGEVLGLKIDDLDTEAKVLRVLRQIQRVKGQGLVMMPPKSATSKRPVIMISTVMEAVRRQLERIEEMRLAAGDRWEERGLLFPNSYGRPIEPRRVEKLFDRVHSPNGASAHYLPWASSQSGNDSVQPWDRGENRPGDLRTFTGVDYEQDLYRFCPCHSQ